MPAQPELFDVAIVGAGVVGTAIARELSKYELDVILIEGAGDVGAGTSKANTAILHTGFDAKPGSTEARLVARGWQLFQDLGPQLGIPIERTGALLIAWSSEEAAALDAIEMNARANGYTRARRVSASEIRRLEPNLGPGAVEGIEIPDESIICTFTTPLAFATQAITNGVQLALRSPVSSISRAPDGFHVLDGPRGSWRSRWLVNAAGLGADRLDRMMGHSRFTIVPRRGELIVFDKLSRNLVQRILLAVPTAAGKGVLVTPTVYGNVLVGPTSEPVPLELATNSTAVGTGHVLDKARRLVPRLADFEVTAVYAGARAATEHVDYQIFAEPDQRYVCVGGIRSTGLTASPAIAEYVVDLMRDGGLKANTKARFDNTTRMPNIGESEIRPYRDAAAIEADPAYGRIICHCERVTEGEIRDALKSLLPPSDADGLRRRTRVLMGRCQGFYCSGRVLELLSTGVGGER
jgi:glycerol-3-phosphate dehydrogenase